MTECLRQAPMAGWSLTALTVRAQKRGQQTFRVEETFSVGRVGGRVMPELALERAYCLSLSELLWQGAPLRQSLRL